MARSKNKPVHLSEQLRKYNKWRRGDNRLKAPDPESLGELIDSAADRLDVLEREHTLFFDNWHEERRRREKLLCAIQQCYEMLLAESDKGAALFQAEDILRAAMADQKHENNADYVGAINVLERGQRLLACGESAQLGRSVKQEPAEVRQAQV